MHLTGRGMALHLKRQAGWWYSRRSSMGVRVIVAAMAILIIIVILQRKLDVVVDVVHGTRAIE